MSEKFEAMLMADGEAIYAKIMAGEEKVSTTVPVAKIDGVAVVEVSFHITKNNAGMILSGRDPLDQDDDYIMFAKNENVEEFTLKMVQTFMKKVESTLQSLRFDAMSTTFVENPRKRKRWELFECETMKMDHGPCVAGCGESTRRKTDCGHHLCLRCHQNIKWVSGHKPCPVCRESIEEYDEYHG
jgi:hypothetical protein